MAVSGVKYSAKQDGFPTNCFPARYMFGRTNVDGSGAWLVAHQDEQKRRFKAVLCSKPRTYSSIKETRKKAETEGAKLDNHDFAVGKDEANAGDNNSDVKILDKFFLMKHCCVDNPADLCSINVSSQEFTDVKEGDLTLFENVAYVNAGENYLPFEAFNRFPSLKELEIPLNGLRKLKVSHTDFSNLEVLDISYNNLSSDDILTLGLLNHLRVLHLTGNNFSSLPQDLAMPYLSREKQVRLQRFSRLEVLLLDDNKLADMMVFAALAGLPKLHHLDLSKNEIFFVPQLKLVEGRVVTQDGRERKRAKQSGNSHRSGRRSKSSSLAEQDRSLLHSTEQEKAENNNSFSAFIGEVTTDHVTEKLKENFPETTGTVLMTDLKIQGLLAEDFSTGDLSARIREFVSENEESPAQIQKKTKPDLPPFPELRYLNLADNKICEEDALLAVAAWPMLSELDIFNNPLTDENCGDPPLLTVFLHDRLGIRLNRLKPQSTPSFMKKGKAEIRPKYRKITEVVPKVPKLSTEEKMMLELPAPGHRAIDQRPSSSSGRGQDGLCLNAAPNEKPVLPPISVKVKEETTEAKTEDATTGAGEKWKVEKEQGKGMPERENSEAFFMTQVDDTSDRLINMHNRVDTHDRVDDTCDRVDDTCDRDDSGEPVTEEVHLMDTGKSNQIRLAGDNMSGSVTEVNDRYKGYELLLNIKDFENESELPPAKDIQANVKALRYALNHTLVYRDPAVELGKVKKMVQEYRRIPVPPAMPRQTYQDKVEDLLTKLRTRSTTEEANLSVVLKEKDKFHTQFPEAEKLLRQIQNRYSSVRQHALTDAKLAKDITENVLELLSSPPAKLK